MSTLLAVPSLRHSGRSLGQQKAMTWHAAHTHEAISQQLLDICARVDPVHDIASHPIRLLAQDERQVERLLKLKTSAAVASR